MTKERRLWVSLSDGFQIIGPFEGTLITEDDERLVMKLDDGRIRTMKKSVIFERVNEYTD